MSKKSSKKVNIAQLMVTLQSFGKSLASGCISGVIITIALQPLDVVKTHMQAAVLLGNPNPGVFKTISQIYYEDCHQKFKDLPSDPVFRRLGRFWTGTCPSLFRCVPGVGGYFMCINSLEYLTHRYFSPIPKSVEAFLVGFTAKSMIVAILNPFLLVKTRTESRLFTKTSMLQMLKQIYSKSGLKGLYNGVLASIAKESPYSGIYLTVYSSLCQFSSVDTDIRIQLIPGFAALSSIVATGITQPADVLRAHRQLMVNFETTGVSNLKLPWLQVFRNIYRTDGLTGFARGFSLRLARRTCVACISWTLYEYLT